MKMLKFLVAGGLAVCLWSACKKDDDNNNLNSQDNEFLKNASISNLSEISAGQVAVTRASSEAVRAFAQMMIMEHTMAQNELQPLADSVRVAIPQQPDSLHLAIVNYLNTLSGRTFDSVYIHTQVVDHQRTDSLFAREQSGGNNSSVKGYANKYRPNIQMHLKHADSLAAFY